MLTINADNRNARASDYDNLPERNLLVHNLFYTLQGEGPYAGTPAVFLRLAGCNFGMKDVACPFCDTDFKFDDGKVMEFEDILLRADGVWDTGQSAPAMRHPMKLLVITGGEPMLQRYFPDFCEFALKCGWTVQVESNGTHSRTLSPRVAVVVSPKAVNNKYHKLSPRVLEMASCLKVLIEDNYNSAYHVIPHYVFEYKQNGGLVYLSPINVYKTAPVSGDSSNPDEVASFWDPDLMDLPACRANHRRAAALALTHGFKLSVQIHLLADAP